MPVTTTAIAASAFRCRRKWPSVVSDWRKTPIERPPKTPASAYGNLGFDAVTITECADVPGPARSSAAGEPYRSKPHGRFLSFLVASGSCKDTGQREPREWVRRRGFYRRELRRSSTTERGAIITGGVCSLVSRGGFRLPALHNLREYRFTGEVTPSEIAGWVILIGGVWAWSAFRRPQRISRVACRRVVVLLVVFLACVARIATSRNARSKCAAISRSLLKQGRPQSWKTSRMDRTAERQEKMSRVRIGYIDRSFRE